MANTGYKAWSTLAKVTDDVNEYPLDINGDLCSVSGLPQATKPNTEGQPDYVAPVTDYVTCPLPEDIDLEMVVSVAGTNSITVACCLKGTITRIEAPIDITVQINKTVSGGGASPELVFITVPTGQKFKNQTYSVGSYVITSATKITAYPTSYGGGTIE